MKQFDVVVIGEINADLILSSDNIIPEFGQVEKVIDQANLVMGSSSAIFACGASRLGLKTAFIGKVGKDIFGDFMITSMQSRGINTDGVVMDESIKTGLSVILAKSGDRAILTYPGSIAALEADEINFSLISKSRHLHLGSYFLLDGLRSDIPHLFRRIKSMGLSISLDTNYDPREQWDGGLKKAMNFTDIFLPNEIEAKAISGEVQTNDALINLSKSIPVVAVKKGENGAETLGENNKIIHQDCIPMNVIDTVGAGDSFDAGFIYGYLNRWDLIKCLKLAVACGSLSTRMAGGTDGQPTILEAMELIE